METIIKDIRKLGNSNGIIIDRLMEKESDIHLGDKVEVNCTKNKITLKKLTNKNKA